MTEKINAQEKNAGRATVDFNNNWKFRRGEDTPDMKDEGYKDSGWEKVTLPHDWAVDGHLKKNTPKFDVPVLKIVEGKWLFDKGDDINKKETGYDDSGWQEVTLPADWETHSDYTEDNAWGWFRRKIDVPESGDFVLDLGCIDDLDETYFNGELIGKSGFLYPYYETAWNVHRFYRVPASFVKKGEKNLVAVRVYDGQGRGGIKALEPINSQDGPFDMAASGGSANGFLPGGTGWYRKEFTVDEGLKDKRITVEFDGVYMDSEVWINGKKLGNRPYGYTSFSHDLTPCLKYGKEKNLIALRLNVKQQCTRWYSGAGIYRNARLVITGPARIKKWGTYITTPQVNDGSALIRIETSVVNNRQTDEKIELETVIYGPAGKRCAAAGTEATVKADSEEKILQEFKIEKPSLWSVETPDLYTAESNLKSGGELIDNYTSGFGIRTAEFTADKGFFLNGKHLPIKGVCLHHDNGYLGTAIHKRAVERQIEIMKAMGCNAIRTSHNPPDPALLDLCDSMGMLVMDEALDEWKENKVSYGYGRFYDEWAEKDLTAMLLRDRNHPSIIIWSIGNEVAEQWAGPPENAEKRTRFLAEITRKTDPTRPVTAGCNNVDDALNKGMAKNLDVFGINYSQWSYEREKGKMPIIATETSSDTSSRGEYNLIIKDGRAVVENTLNGHVSSYDDYAPQWATPAWKSIKAVEDAPWIAGEFVWTGFDYIGEPTPFWWPSVISYFGITDLCGFPKDRYYLYQSRWSDKPMVHMLPHWNWPEPFNGREIPVYVYTNCESAELLLNGRPLGEKAMKDAEKLRLEWSIPYEPGILEVKAKNKGEIICSKKNVTSGAPARIKLEADRHEIDADGRDLSYITATAVDKDGNFCPLADNMVKFKCKGHGIIAATGNGDPTNHAFFKEHECRLFNGMCLVIIRSAGKPGKIKISAESPGLKDSSAEIQAE